MILYGGAATLHRQLKGLLRSGLPRARIPAGAGGFYPPAPSFAPRPSSSFATRRAVICSHPVRFKPALVGCLVYQGAAQGRTSIEPAPLHAAAQRDWLKR